MEDTLLMDWELYLLVHVHSIVINFLKSVGREFGNFSEIGAESGEVIIFPAVTELLCLVPRKDRSETR